MGSGAAIPQWTSEPCIMGIDEAGRGPVLGPMVYGCLYCARSYEKTLSSLNFADSKTLKEEKREELFENLKADESIGWAVDIIDPRELSAKMLKKNKINLNEISHDSAIGLITKVLNMGVLLTEKPSERETRRHCRRICQWKRQYGQRILNKKTRSRTKLTGGSEQGLRGYGGDAEKYRTKLSERFPAVKFVVAKKADSLYPVVSGASIVAKVTRDRALQDWVLEETAEDLHKNFGSGYPGDPNTKAWLQHHKHLVFGFPTLVRFSWGTCTPYFKDIVEVLWESNETDADGSSSANGKRQLKLSNFGVTKSKRKIEEIESSDMFHESCDNPGTKFKCVRLINGLEL
ncbi:ribonuclease H2 subunit A isoform X1 [Prunus yedoensis var. nudiflora]|uniref:Ribonuclease n=1 Tax=Prunus yedoensis var. nudiflora TaxID=2094558 RepID=A0A314YLE4_PRUYE|nr:ribonuclease H2 subunit A isoform X1 [Prunus yedoensis var. nudiflora]